MNREINTIGSKNQSTHCSAAVVQAKTILEKCVNKFKILNNLKELHMKKQRGLLIVLSGPSGVGEGTVRKSFLTAWYKLRIFDIDDNT